MATNTYAAPQLTAWTTHAVVDWPSLLTTSVGSALYQQSVANYYYPTTTNNVPHHSLDGYAFFCDGLVIGFAGDESLICQSAHGGSTFDCGTFRYYADVPILSISIHDAPMTAATDLLYQDSVLLSFRTDATCHVVSLDWQHYSLDDYFGMSCVQPHDEHHFALGLSGDVALRSKKVLSDTNTVVRDSYGVYQWNDDESIKIYFGPQQGREVTVMEGTLSKSQLEVGSLTEACTHDGSSTILTLQDLPKTDQDDDKRPRRRGVARLLQSLFLKRLQRVQELWILAKNSWMFLLVRSGFGGHAGLGVTATAVLQQFVKNWTKLHPSDPQQQSQETAD